MPNILQVFNIQENYTLEELKKSYLNIIENLSKSNNTQIEKDLLLDQYTKLYKQAKQLCIERTSLDIDTESNNFLSIRNRNRNNMFNSFFLNNVFGEMINKTNKIDNINYKNPQIYSYSSSKSYSSKINPDGSSTIIESKSESKNGSNNKTINAYKKLPNGKIVPLSDKELKQIEN